MKQRHFSFYTKSFTLIEMLIVIVIIGILATALIPRLQSVQTRARNAQRKVDMSTLTTAIKIYYNDYGNYPRGLGHLVTGNIITSLPRDPQMSVRHPCAFWTGGWGTDPLADGYYFTSGFYNDSGNCTTIENCSAAHYGYIYVSCAYSNQCKYAAVGAWMENDGSINSYGAFDGSGAYLACNWGNNYSEWGNRGALGKYNAWASIINEARGSGLNSRGKIFLHGFDAGGVIF